MFPECFQTIVDFFFVLVKVQTSIPFHFSPGIINISVRYGLTKVNTLVVKTKESREKNNC